MAYPPDETDNILTTENVSYGPFGGPYRIDVGWVRGSPEGVVDGQLGARRYQIGTSIEWLKMSPGGNTGWVQQTSSPGSTAPIFPWLNAADFGMLPTSSDASIPLNATILAANTAGSRCGVYIPPGLYTMRTTVRHRADVCVFGCGSSTRLNFIATVGTAWDFDTGFLRSELGGLQILGVFGSPPTIGVDMQQSQKIYMHDLQIWDFQTGVRLSAGVAFSAYIDIERCEVNRSTVIGIQALANANANRIGATRVFFTYNNTSTGIGIDVADVEGLELDDVQVEAADTCIRVRNTSGLTNLDTHGCYFEPGTNPTTLVVGQLFDVDVSNLFDGVEVVRFRNNFYSGNRGTAALPPESFCEFDGYSRAFYGARFNGAAVPKRNLVYNGELLYYGLPSVLPNWGVAGAVPTLSSNAAHVTGVRSLQAIATGVSSTVLVGFTVSDEGVEWVTCGIRYQIIAGNVGFSFTGTVGANSRQYVPEPTPTGVWRTAWVNVPVDPANRNGGISFVIDSVNGNGTILIDEAWAVPGRFAIPSTQYGERLQFLPAPIPILTRAGIIANEVFGPIDITTLPATLAPPLDAFSAAPVGVVGVVLRMFIENTGAPAGLLANFHQMYVDIPGSGAIVAASFEFLQAIYQGQFHTKDIIVRDTTISGGYTAGDGFASDYSLALIAWVLA